MCTQAGRCGLPVILMGSSPIQHIFMLHIMQAAHGRLQRRGFWRQIVTIAALDCLFTVQLASVVAWQTTVAARQTQLQALP